MSNYSRVSIRTVNAFLTKKSIDPKEFKEVSKVHAPKLGKRIKSRLEKLIVADKKILVYRKGSRIVLRDMNRKYNFMGKRPVKV